MTHQTLSLEKYWKLFPATLIKIQEDQANLKSRVVSGRTRVTDQEQAGLDCARN